MSLVTMISNLVQFTHLLSFSCMPGIVLSIMFNGERVLSNHLSRWFLFRRQLTSPPYANAHALSLLPTHVSMFKPQTYPAVSDLFSPN